LPTPTPLQKKIAPKGVDSDADGLTNAEEALLGCVAENTDSDVDSFMDGYEVEHGYDPASKGTKLETSKFLKKEMIGSINLLVPKTWERKTGSRGVILFETGSPENIEIVSDPLGDYKDLQAWLLSKYPASAVADYQAGKTLNGANVIYSKDGRMVWFVSGDSVYAFLYATDEAQYSNYETIFKMMINSLRIEL